MNNKKKWITEIEVNKKWKTKGPFDRKVGISENIIYAESSWWTKLKSVKKKDIKNKGLNSYKILIRGEFYMESCSELLRALILAISTRKIRNFLSLKEKKTKQKKPENICIILLQIK